MTKADPHINEQYPMFMRNDVKELSFWKCLPFLMTLWPRAFIVFGIIITYTVYVNICMLGHKAGQPLHPVRRILTKLPGQYMPRALIFCFGVLWIKVTRPEVDWRQYLGPDWKPVYKGASTYICNHSSWMDILVYMWWDLPSFLSKKEIRNYLGVGLIAEAI
jgi:hypothetical protein